MTMVIVGRLGRDAEIRYTPNGTPVAALSLAYDYGQKGQDGRRPTQWIEATLWGEQGPKLAEHLIKGTVLTVALRDVHIEEFTRRDGIRGNKLAGTVMALQFTPRQRERADGGAPPAKPVADTYAPKAPPTRTAQGPSAAPAPPTSGDEMPFDDDIPF